MDLVETGDELVLRDDLPGMTEDDVEIEIKDGEVRVPKPEESKPTRVAIGKGSVEGTATEKK